MADLSDLKSQIESTIKALSMKQQSSSEAIVDTYLKKYSEVLSLVDSGESEDKIVHQAQGLLNLARGYMETSSDYQQDFLNEMGKTEKLVKQL